MKRILAIAATLAVAIVALLASRTPAETATPSASPQPAATPARVFVVNQPAPPASFFPASNQETGVWQGCGPAQDQGVFEDFNRDHARARIVQVFIDASIPCKAAGSHAFVIVYQDEARPFRRSVRYPMAR